MKVTDLKMHESLTISNRSGSQVIIWKKKPDASSIFKFRRMCFINKQLVTVMDIRKLGSAEDEELAFRKSLGWRQVT